jgi:DNA-directed RNA polymerase subunit RPC12/RpoP
MAWRKQNINITYNEYVILLEQQDYKCKICGKQLERSAPIDHCHKTGKIRAVLCPMCNKGIGMFNDDSELLKCAADYLDFYAQ